MRKLHPVSLGNTLIWAVTILAVAIVLHWSENEGMVVVILGGAAGASILLISDALRKS
jgi:hypothetical protein